MLMEFNNNFNPANQSPAPIPDAGVFGVNYADMPNINMDAMRSYHADAQAAASGVGSGFSLGLGSALGGSLLGAGLGFINDIINRQTNIAEAAKQRNWQHAMMLEQQKYNTEMWNKNNEYNSPSAQLERLLALGINPSTAIGMLNGGNSAAPAAAATAGNGAAANAPQSSVPGMAQTGSQLGLTDVEAEGLAIDNEYKPFEKEANINKSYAEIDALVAKGELDRTQAAQIRELLPLLKAEKMANIELILNTGQKVLVEMEKMAHEIELLDQKTITELYNQKLISAKTYEAYTQSQLNLANVDVAQSQAELNRAETYTQQQTAAKIMTEVFANQYNNALRSAGIDPDAKGIRSIIQTVAHMPTALSGYSSDFGFKTGPAQKALSVCLDLAMLALPELKGAGMIGKAVKGYRGTRAAGGSIGKSIIGALKRPKIGFR